MTQAVVRPRIGAGEIALAAFMGTVVMLFAGFTSSYFIRRAGADWVPISLPPMVAVNTVVLLVSSLTIELAARRRSGKLLATSVVLGLGFLAGQWMAWQSLSADGIGLGANPHGAFFYMLSAVHGVHLVGGLGAMLAVVLRKKAWRLTANYWHFMGLIWCYVLFLLLAV